MVHTFLSDIGVIHILRNTTRVGGWSRGLLRCVTVLDGWVGGHTLNYVVCGFLFFLNLKTEERSTTESTRGRLNQ